MTSRKPEHSVAFVFPGIGVELSGREKSLFDEFASLFSPYFTTASEMAKIDLGEFLRRDRVPELSEWESQLFIYAFSVATASLCREHGWKPECVAGYSFGVYAALATAGVLSFTDGLAVLEKAYALMTAGKRERSTGMCAVIGLSLGELTGFIAGQPLPALHHSNSNNEFCHVFCGEREQILILNRLAMEAGAINAVELTVSLPYHHPALAAAVTPPFREFCTAYAWRSPAVPLYSTIDCEPLTDAEAVREFVVHHLTTPINWYRTVEAMYAHGCRRMLECGPGISLTQNARFMAGAAKWINVKNLQRRLSS